MSIMTADINPDLCRTGIEGLDFVLCGGLPRNCLYLVQGEPGSGKTTLAMQFLLEGVRSGERGFYITLSETEEELQKIARSHDWELDQIPHLELSAIDPLLRPEAQTTVFHTAELELNAVTRLLLSEVRKHQPARVVFDSLSEFRLMSETPLRYRRQLLSIKQQLIRQGCTALLLDDNMNGGLSKGDPHVLSLAHGVLELGKLAPDYGRFRRRLCVQKMRAVSFREGFHDYVLEKGGLRVFPRLIAAEHRRRIPREQVQSGVRELDDLLGGGLDRGTTSLIVGQAGTGKSTIALRYASQMASMGERSILFAFDETIGIALDRCRNLKLGVPAFADKGLIDLQQVDPAEISPGEFADLIYKSVEAGCKLVVVDTLNGYLNAMPGERHLNSQLHELSAYLNQSGVLTIYIVTQNGLITGTDSPVDVSYLADTVVSLRCFEARGSVRTAVAVVKKRSGRHERTIREFMLLTGEGIRMGPPLQEFQHVLGGTPLFQGDGEQMLNGADG